MRDLTRITDLTADGIADLTGDNAPAAHPVREPRRTARTPSRTAQRLQTDPENVERDLVKLVLTLVELIRQLMERQALRRVEEGSLTDDQTEKLGTALMRLEEAMAHLRDHFDLRPEDLNLDLGPLGPLLPEQ
ncbi:gas vesicle protein K [Actinomadura logoneensis]|uniref:Gas vesicle protein K n=2 Tax=Actinomadura logoneensis TaxID=2293572 RepID=A0A372JSP5_9ACTN|nr:gas vesicle protein K [Actinomadura logoneensis]